MCSSSFIKIQDLVSYVTELVTLCIVVNYLYRHLFSKKRRNSIASYWVVRKFIFIVHLIIRANRLYVKFAVYVNKVLGFLSNRLKFQLTGNPIIDLLRYTEGKFLLTFVKYKTGVFVRNGVKITSLENESVYFIVFRSDLPGDILIVESSLISLTGGFCISVPSRSYCYPLYSYRSPLRRENVRSKLAAKFINCLVVSGVACDMNVTERRNELKFNCKKGNPKDFILEQVRRFESKLVVKRGRFKQYITPSPSSFINEILNHKGIIGRVRQNDFA